MDDHPYGLWSLAPPVVAIVLSIATRHVVASLILGVLCGSMILHQGNWGAAIVDAAETRLWSTLVNEELLRVFTFTLLMGAMVGVVNRCGGMHGVVQLLSVFATNRRRGKILVWILGLVVFFDDYANTLLLGTTMRPLTDRLRISREKLAYLVDSTAAPVAGLAIVSTWVAGEIGYIDSGTQGLFDQSHAATGFDLFVASIPYRFYVLFSLVFGAFVALTQRDFGPMLTAERKAITSGSGALGGIEKECEEDSLAPPADIPRRWVNAAIPVTLTVGVTLLLLVLSGGYSSAPGSLSWWAALSKGDSYISLVYGALTGFCSAVLLASSQRLLSWRQVKDAAMKGAQFMLPALTILWVAKALSDMTGSSPAGSDILRLDTAAYLSQLLTAGVSVVWMPTIVFILASTVAFATGTSWGTMGLLMPLSIQVTYQLLQDSNPGGVDAYDPVLLATIGSVLAGAIFGDHCSPISDTTILSSQSSGCNHIAHVWTQMPYALAVAGIAIVCGTIPAGWGISPWFLLPLGIVAMLVVLYVFGAPADEQSE